MTLTVDGEAFFYFRSGWPIALLTPRRICRVIKVQPTRGAPEPLAT
ncbi:hypothetical protein [Stieleria neptunia]|nr:hypothetical protein [Stieleria neptunia]